MLVKNYYFPNASNIVFFFSTCSSDIDMLVEYYLSFCNFTGFFAIFNVVTLNNKTKYYLCRYARNVFYVCDNVLNVTCMYVMYVTLCA